MCDDGPEVVVGGNNIHKDGVAVFPQDRNFAFAPIIRSPGTLVSNQRRGLLRPRIGSETVPCNGIQGRAHHVADGLAEPLSRFVLHTTETRKCGRPIESPRPEPQEGSTQGGSERPGRSKTQASPAHQIEQSGSVTCSSACTGKAEISGSVELWSPLFGASTSQDSQAVV